MLRASCRNYKSYSAGKVSESCFKLLFSACPVPTMRAYRALRGNTPYAQSSKHRRQNIVCSTTEGVKKILNMLAPTTIPCTLHDATEVENRWCSPLRTVHREHDRAGIYAVVLALFLFVRAHSPPGISYSPHSPPDICQSPQGISHSPPGTHPPVHLNHHRVHLTYSPVCMYLTHHRAYLTNYRVPWYIYKVPLRDVCDVKSRG